MISYDTLKPAIDSRLIPIVPEDALHFYDRGIHHKGNMLQVPDRITRKVVRCFQTTWLRIREKDRKTLVEHWQSLKTPGGRACPFIGFNLFRTPKNAAAAYRECEFTFALWYVDDATPTSLCHLIAHEIGHAMSYRHGWFQQHDHQYQSHECVACECRAYSYMAGWGFDPFLNWLPKRKHLIDRFTKR